MTFRFASRLMVLLSLLPLQCAACPGDELVYRHYFDEIISRIDRDSASTPDEWAVVANRLLLVDWPESMSEDVCDLIQKLCRKEDLHLSPNSISIYARHRRSLPDFLQRAIIIDYDRTEAPDRLYFIEAICKAPKVMEQTVPLLSSSTYEDDIVISTAAAVALFHARPDSQVERNRVARLLRSKNPEVRMRVADRISLLPEVEISVFLDSLRVGLSSTDARVQVTSAKAILAANPTDVESLRVFALHFRNEEVGVCIGYLTPSNQGMSVAEYISISLTNLFDRHVETGKAQVRNYSNQNGE